MRCYVVVLLLLISPRHDLWQQQKVEQYDVRADLPRSRTIHQENTNSPSTVHCLQHHSFAYIMTMQLSPIARQLGAAGDCPLR